MTLFTLPAMALPFLLITPPEPGLAHHIEVRPALLPNLGFRTG
jgi:hypothetical protein